ncbi:MAG: DNA-binding response regulator [Bacteroidetes bacterium]|nr:MAG: DNA-binding response regulator [Bacteroidota bacterium]
MVSNTTLATCIVDDEAGMRNNLKYQLNALNLPVRLVGEACNVAEGIALLQEQEPDLVFLDVEMPDGKGFDLLKKMPELSAKVIFVTAHNHYAVEAFAVGKALQAKEKESYQLKINTFLNNMEDISTKYKKIVLKNSDSIFVVNVSDIIRLEASNNYTTFFVENQPPIMVSKTLKEYEEILTNYGFYRVHQSHLINLNFFARYDKKDGGVVVLKDKTTLPIAAKKKDLLFEYLERL